MAKVTINGKDYDEDSLAKESKEIVNSLKFIRSEKLRLNAQVAILKTAESSYTRALQEQLEKDN
tara:strand:+ start:620 stop:811 length:192 start_codon:yes stop_codon:yes gene_type:complete